MDMQTFVRAYGANIVRKLYIALFMTLLRFNVVV